MKDYIQLLTVPSNAPSNFLENGQLFLDTAEGFSFSITENAAQLTQANDLKGDGLLSIGLPKTPKNLFVFNKYLSPNQASAVFDPLEVVCITGGMKVLPQNLCFFKSASDETEGLGSIEIELLPGNEYWVSKAKNLYLNQIDLGSFQVTVNSILNNWNEDGLYIDANENNSVWPVINYGRFMRPQDDFYGIMIEDLRPLISMHGLLKQGFKAIGYKFQSPLTGAEWFNRLWVYELAEKLDYEDRGVEFQGYTRNLSSQAAGGQFIFGPHVPLNFPDRINDPSDGFSQQDVETVPQVGSYEATMWQYTRPGNSDFRSVLTFRVSSSLFGAYDTFFDVALYSYPDQERLDIEPNIEIPQGANFADVEVVFNFNVEFGQRVYLAIEAVHGSITGLNITLDILAGAEWQLSPESDQIYPGDTVPTGQLLHPERTFFEFLKGCAHLFFGKIEEDREARTITIFPPERTRVFEDEIEGFFLSRDNFKDLSEYIVDGSEEIQIEDEETARFVRLSFADSDCGFINAEELEDEAPLYSRLVDLGEGEDRIERYENPHFEPTANIDFYRRSIPAMWEETKPEAPGLKIGPRVLYCVGNVDMKIGATTVEESSAWVFETYELKKILYFGQEPRRPYLDGGATVVSDKSVVYQATEENELDLFKMFWKFKVWQLNYSKNYIYTAVLPFEVFDSISFRQLVFVAYRQTVLAGSLQSKENYEPANDMAAQITIKPDARPFEGF
jgi:hypothetical protein